MNWDFLTCGSSNGSDIQNCTKCGEPWQFNEKI